MGYMKGEDFEYLGGFQKGEYSMLGRIKTKGFFYIGMWQESREHGLGYFKSTQVSNANNPESYFGYWNQGLKHGYGFEFCQTETYQGEFR